MVHTQRHSANSFNCSHRTNIPWSYNCSTERHGGKSVLFVAPGQLFICFQLTNSWRGVWRDYRQIYRLKELVRQRQHVAPSLTLPWVVSSNDQIISQVLITAACNRQPGWLDWHTSHDASGRSARARSHPVSSRCRLPLTQLNMDVCGYSWRDDR